MPDRSAPASSLTSVPAGTELPRISVSAAAVSSAKVDLTVCFAYEAASPELAGVPSSSALGKALARVMRDERFKGKRREMIVWHAGGRHAAVRYVVVGLGKRQSASLDALRDGCGQVARRACASSAGGARRMALLLPPVTTYGPAELAEAAAEGIALGAYRMSKYFTAEENAVSALRSVDILVGKDQLKEARVGVSRGAIRSTATALARDLVNETAMALTPAKMADVARRIAKQRGLEIKVLGRKELEKLGAGAILGVSAGSSQPPCLIHLVYRPRRGAGRPVRRVALVGKGLTFDSGGLSLKTASGMETMKMDKAGASAVLAAMSALPQLQPPVEVHGIMGMTENMPGGSATKPGDILTSLSGKTIEVLNTDAEGRLVLADALTYAQRQKVDEIIDLATLTGACMVALGPVVTGVFGNDQGLVNRFLEAAHDAGEMMWQLPLCDEYKDQIRSDVADLKNSPATRYGGAITAGLFLKSFVDDKVRWVHLDIAGPAFLESERGFMRKGATGAGVRSLLTYIESLGRAEPA